MILSTDPEDDEAGEAWERAQAALFAHVGVTDPEDWRSVALRLACRYAPELLTEAGPCEPPAPARKVGRPEKWTESRLFLLANYIDIVKEWSKNGRVRPDIKTNIDACKLIAGNYAETQRIREGLGIEAGFNPATLDNLGRVGREQERRRWANGKG